MNDRNANANAGLELFHQNATHETGRRGALQGCEFAGERSPEPIAPGGVQGEKLPGANVALHGRFSMSQRVASVAAGLSPCLSGCAS